MTVDCETSKVNQSARTTKYARRLTNLPAYHSAHWAGHVESARQKGRDVIPLYVGSPDMPPPDAVIETLRRSAGRADSHGYPGHRGTRALREAIAGYYQRRFGVVLDPETQVLPLLGSKEGIIHLSMAYLDADSLALVPDPGYAPYTRGAALSDAATYTLPLRAENDFLPDFDAVPARVLDRAKLLWLNYPNNPTGATADLGFFERAVAFARQKDLQKDLLICHDAPYCDVTYEGYVAPSILQVAGAGEVAVEINSLSKTFNMAGWRIGMAVGNADAIAALTQVKSNVDSGIFHPLQAAAVEALATPTSWLATRNAIYYERLALIAGQLNEICMRCTPPIATLYAWAEIPPGWPSSEAFALALLEETGVAIAPGVFFGPAGEGYVRISATAPTVRVQEAMTRLAQFVTSAA